MGHQRAGLNEARILTQLANRLANAPNQPPVASITAPFNGQVSSGLRALFVAGQCIDAETASPNQQWLLDGESIRGAIINFSLNTL